MKIVVLDGHTLNPGDLDWSPLQVLGDCVIHERTLPSEVLKRAQAAQILLTNKVLLDRATLEQLPRLRYVGVLATGYNVVDVEAAHQLGVVVSNVPAYSTASVAQLVFALLFELAHHLAGHAQAVRDGRWSKAPDFTFWDRPLIELAGKTLGIIGYGSVGSAVATIGAALGMEVVAHTRRPVRATTVPVGFVGLDDVFRRADVVSLHCPLSEATRGMVNAARLGLMKPTAYLINTARGPLVDEAALARALADGQIAGAGLDVLSVEPPPSGHPLLGAPNCVITPHIGWATTAARARLLHEVVDNVRAFLEGRRRNVV